MAKARGWTKRAQVQQLIDGLAAWMSDFEERGWEGFLLTLMFRKIDGPPKEVAAQMNDEVRRVYATLVTRVR